jgi:hypothetical protein
MARRKDILNLIEALSYDRPKAPSALIPPHGGYWALKTYQMVQAMRKGVMRFI